MSETLQTIIAVIIFLIIFGPVAVRLAFPGLPPNLAENLIKLRYAIYTQMQGEEYPFIVESENPSEFENEETEIAPEIFVKKDYPRNLEEFVGQTPIKKELGYAITAARIRGAPLRHTLFYGPPGLGKTTLSEIAASEMQTRLISIVGSSIRSVEDIVGLMRKIQGHDILFIDEIHRISPKLMEEFYHVLESYRYLYSKDGQIEEINLPEFTIIGATTSFGVLPKPLRDRFRYHMELFPYTLEELTQIVGLLSSLDTSLSGSLASRSQGTPRIAKGLLANTNDYVLATGQEETTQTSLDYVFGMKGIDHAGLVPTQRKIIRYLSAQDYPVGRTTLCAALNIDTEDLETLYEPWLLQKHLMIRTPRGRQITSEGTQHLTLVQEER